MLNIKFASIYNIEIMITSILKIYKKNKKNIIEGIIELQYIYPCFTKKKGI